MNWKNRLWQFFLAIVVGATLSVCNSAMDTNNFEAIAGSISDGSDQGYMRIGNMQIVWGSVTLPGGNGEFSATFPVTFLSKPIVTIAHGCTGSCSAKGNFYSVSTTQVTFKEFTGDDMNYIAVGKWQ